MSALQSAMTGNDTRLTNIAPVQEFHQVLHHQVLAIEGQSPDQADHPEYSQDPLLRGPPMPIPSQTFISPQVTPVTAPE